MSYGKSVDGTWCEPLSSDARDTVRITVLKQKEINDVVDRIKLLVRELGKENPILGKVKMLYDWLNNKPDRATFGILMLELDRIEKIVAESKHAS